jgi:hypothetical protein
MLTGADGVVCETAGSAIPGTPDGTPQIESAAHRAVAARIITILAKLADLWPQTLLALGVILTLVWSGVLVWWLMAIVGLT